MSKDSDLPPIPSTSTSGIPANAQRERSALGTGLFKKLTTKLRSPSSSPVIASGSPCAAPTPANSPNVGTSSSSPPSPADPAKTRRKGALRMPSMTLPKPAGPPPVVDSFTSPEHRQAALRARGLIPAASSPYRDAQGYRIPLSEQEKVLDQRFATEVERGGGGGVDAGEGDSEAQRIREAWLRRNREDGEGAGAGGVRASESAETDEGNVTFGRMGAARGRGTLVRGPSTPVSESAAVLDTSHSLRASASDADATADLSLSPRAPSMLSPRADTETHLVFVSPLAPPSPSDIAVLTHTPSPSLSAHSPPRKGKEKGKEKEKDASDAAEKVARWLQTSSPTGTTSPKALPIPVSGSAPLEPPESESLEQIIKSARHSQSGAGAGQQLAHSESSSLPASPSTNGKRRPSPIVISSTPPSSYSPPHIPLPSPPAPGLAESGQADIDRRQSVVSRLSANVPSLTNASGTSEPSVSLATPTTTVSRYPSTSSDDHSRSRKDPSAHEANGNGVQIQRKTSTSTKPMLLGSDATVIIESSEIEDELREFGADVSVNAVASGNGFQMSKSGMSLLQVGGDEKSSMRKSSSFGLFGRKSGKGEVRSRHLVFWSRFARLSTDDGNVRSLPPTDRRRAPSAPCNPCRTSGAQ